MALEDFFEAKELSRGQTNDQFKFTPEFNSSGVDGNFL